MRIPVSVSSLLGTGAPSEPRSGDALFAVAPLLSHLSDACLLLDQEGTIRFANARAHALLGRPSESLVDGSAWTAFPRQAAEVLASAHARLLGGASTATERVWLGGRRPLDAHLTPLGDAVLLLLVDRGAHDHTLVFDNIQDGVLLMDERFRIVDWNAAAERIFGYTRAEAIGRSPEFFHHPELAGRLEHEIRESLLARGRWAGELPFRRKDGVDGVADVIVVEQRDESGALLGYVGVNRDATDRVHADAAQRMSEAQLRHAQKMEAVGRLAGGVAHDFNNILTVITSYAELLYTEFDEGDERRRDVEEVLKATTRAVGLTRQLLTFGRRQRLKPALVDPAGVVRGMGAVLRQLAGDGIELVTTAAGDGWLVRVEQGQLEQVVTNLAVNSRDAMPRGGTLTVDVAPTIVTAAELARRAQQGADDVEEAMSPERPGEYVVIRVSDTGQGMSPELRRHIFEPFFTTKRVGQGGGLGLATVYAVVMQAAGFVRVRSAPGDGTTIEVFLPRALPDEHERERTSGATNLIVRGGTETILVVEDEMAVRLSVRRILERSGYRVLEARHGADALRLWRERRGEIALVLSDVIMPEMGGIELASVLRAEEPSVRLLFMSGYTGAADADGESCAVASPLLQKPFEGVELLRAVRRELDRATA